MLNRQLKWILAIILIGLTASVISYKTELSNACSVRQLSIANEVEKYDQTKNPQFCDVINTQIFQFDDSCKSDVEELDCG